MFRLHNRHLSGWRVRSVPFCNVLCTFLVLLTTAPFVSADPSGGGGATTSSSPTVDNKSDGNALRLSVVNAVTDYVNNARVASYNLDWDLLPETDALWEMVNSVQPTTITIVNTELKPRDWDKNPKPGDSGSWVNKINGDARMILQKALGVKDLADLRSQPNEDTYLAALLAKNDGISLTSNEVITAQLDHLALRLALSSNGIGYDTIVSDAQVQGGQKHHAENIRWTIALYPFKTFGNFTVYRVTMKADLIRPEKLIFPSTTQTQAKLTVRASLLASPATIGLQLAEVGSSTTNLNLAVADPESLSGAEALSGGSTIEGILKFVGSTDLGTAVSSSLFSGDARASLYYGGLVGQGQIKQVVGVNRLLSTIGGQTSDSGVGVLIGIAPGRNNALFVGPSLQVNEFTVAVGGIGLEKDKPEGGKKTGIYPAITVAYDLSRTLGGKKNIQTIQLQNSVIGGSSDVVAQGVFGLRIQITLDPTLTDTDKQALKNAYIRVLRTATFDPNTGRNVPITDSSNRNVFQISVPTPVDIRIIPRGYYVLDPTSLPAGFALYPSISTTPILPPTDTNGQPNPNGFPVGQRGQTTTVLQTYVVKKIVAQ